MACFAASYQTTWANAPENKFRRIGIPSSLLLLSQFTTLTRKLSKILLGSGTRMKL